MDTEISRRLLELRNALCLKQKEFGEKIHISKGYITSLEKCRQPLNDRIIKLLTDTYGVNPEWLKHGKGAMFLESHNSQIAEIIHSFNQLNPDFQNFIVGQIKKLLEMNHNYQEGNLRPSVSVGVQEGNLRPSVSVGVHKDNDEKPEIKPKKTPPVPAKGSKSKLDKKG